MHPRVRRKIGLEPIVAWEMQTAGTCAISIAILFILLDVSMLCVFGFD